MSLCYTELVLHCSIWQSVRTELQSFAELFFKHYPIEELSGYDIHDVIGMLRTNYEAIAAYKQRRVKVQVFNPDSQD